MIPQTRHSLPCWEYSLDGTVVGWVERVRIGKSTRVFYKAIGLHPITGKRVSLENSTDRDERIRVLAAFHHDPSRYSRHYRESVIGKADESGRPDGFCA